MHKVKSLKAEYAKNPLGIETQHPRLSWQAVTDVRSWKQSAYRVWVSSCAEELENDTGNMWDSGKVVSSGSINVRYGGRTLEAGRRYYWKVRTWDEAGNAADSKSSYWEMGLLVQENWIASWIGSGDSQPKIMPIFRREFKVEKPVQSARIYSCGLGQYELSLNGDKVGDSVLEPGWTNYRKSCLYSIYDVSTLLRVGDNALGVMLGNGMYNVSGDRYTKFKGSFGDIKLILQLKLDYEDGSTEYIVTDETWKTAPGPITFSCTFGGEDYDARLEQRGWNAAGFIEDENWKPAVITASPGGILKYQSNPPLKEMRSFNSISVREPKPGIFIYDLGQNFSGWFGMTVRGPAGAAVRITPSELLTEEGTAYQAFTGDPHYYVYTLRGGEEEQWSPRFTYYGFRYIQVEGAIPSGANASLQKNIPVLERMEGRMIYPDVETAGLFECSHPLLNKIHEIIQYAILSNMKSVLTDCPHREKLGWLEQSHLIGPSIMSGYGVHNLYRKIMADMREAQLENGLVPDIAPEYIVFESHEGYRDSPEWGSACIINPWYMYREYGDADILAESYDVMCSYLEYLSFRTVHHVLHHGLGDWLDVGPNPPFSQNTPLSVTATAIYYYDITIMEQVAKLLDKPEDVRKFSQLGKEVRDAFNIEFFDSQGFRYANGSQASNAMALYMDIVEEPYVEKVLDNLVKDIRIRGNHTTAGDVGHPYVMGALVKYGRSDVVADMLKQEGHPSYGYQIKHGATALCEDWDGPEPGKPHGSHNHLMLGSAEGWFFSELAGIQTAGDPGKQEVIRIKPHIDRDVEWVKAYREHPCGRIDVEWRKGKDQNLWTLDISIPANTTGLICIPCHEGDRITESRKPLPQVQHIEIAGEADGTLVLKTGSGKYSFTIEQEGR